MSWLLTNLMAAVLLPPFSFLLLAGVGLCCLYAGRLRLGRALVLLSLCLGWLCSSGFFVEKGLQWLESSTRPVNLVQAADAIVILGGGTYYHAPEYGGQHTVKYTTLERLRYGAYLHRQTDLPILVSGGAPEGHQRSEAAQMAEVLEQDFLLPVAWQEAGSDNTFDNARLSYALLQPQGVQRIYLVTHAWHMPRAARIFRQVGFEVVEAPTAFTTDYRTTLLDFVPDAAALHRSQWLIHELIGEVWYRLRWWWSTRGI